MAHVKRAEKLPEVIGPEYFKRKQAQYVRQVARGRHPRSFGRMSELWHHALSTGKRLDAIRAGRDIWSVLEESEEEARKVPEEECDSLSPDARDRGELAAAAALNVGVDAADGDVDPAQGTLETAAALGQIDFSVNGIHTDIRNKITLHYGMLVTIMNGKQDIVCVTHGGQPMIKNVHSVQHTDRMLFKLVDLRDATNPHPIKFGDSVWLQIVDPQVGINTSSSWHQSAALCTKLFALNEMETAHLNPGWEKDAQRETLLARISQQQLDSEEPHRPPLSMQAEAKKKEDDEAEEKKKQEAAVAGPAKGRQSKWKSLKDSKIVKKISDEAVAEGVKSTASHANKERGAGATTQAQVIAAKSDPKVCQAIC